MEELEEDGALWAGRPAFVAAALASRDVAPRLSSALERVPGVGRVIARAGVADPDGPAPQRAVVAIALLDSTRAAIDLGDALAEQLGRDDAAAPEELRGLGLASSEHAPHASLSTLVAVALEGARVVRPARRGGVGLAHSELYELETRRPNRAFSAEPTPAEPGATEPPTPAHAATLVPKTPGRAPEAGPEPVRPLEARAHLALVAQLRAEVEGLRAERGRADRAHRRDAIEQQLLALSTRLGRAEAEGQRLGLVLPGPALDARLELTVGPTLPPGPTRSVEPA